MEVDNESIQIPGITVYEKKAGLSPIYIPLYDHPWSEYFVEFHKTDYEEQLKLLVLAMKFKDNNLDLSREWNATEFEEELKSLKKDHNAKIKRIQDKNKKMKVTIEDLEDTREKSILEYETKLEESRIQSKIQIENLFKTKVEALKEENDTLREEKNEKEIGFYKTLEEKTESIRENYEEKMEELRENKNNELEELRERLYKVDSNQKVSANKGTAGEEVVEEWLTEFFPTGELENTAKQGGKADMILTYKEKPILIEVKTDKRNVQKVGIKKFEKEMRNLPEIAGGLFISLNAGVAGKMDWQVQMYGSKPGLYLCNVNNCPRSIIGAINFLYQLMNSEMNVETKKATIKAVKNHRKTLLQNTTKLKNQMKQNDIKLMEHIDRINESTCEFAKNMINETEEEEEEEEEKEDKESD